ncbi:MAG: branched-chain amino acid ABC transporter permease [Alphaproteobacteria bacterium]|nr:branched-chain amino acid ABC transporter permease [Alphaproteobacteria bacterium]
MTLGDLWLQQLINGLNLGAMYSLLALGFTLVYCIMELINFSHFNVFMVGAFIALGVLKLMGMDGQSVILTGLPLIGVLTLTFLITMFSSGMIGVGIERLLLRPLRAVTGPAAMILTIGVSYILFNIILIGIGGDTRNFANPLPSVAWNIGGAVLRMRDVLIWGITIVLMLGLTYFVQYTKLGKGMRATAQDPEAARMMGVEVDNVVALSFFIGSALAGASGLIFGLYYNYAKVDMGFAAGLRAFTAAVLGGIGNVPGAMLGGVLIGLIESGSSQLIGQLWADVVIFSILVIVLVFRPAGLLGRQAPNKS